MPNVDRDVLTEVERNALDDSLMDSGCHGFQGDHPDLYATAERIVRERMAQAWDDGVRYAWDDPEPHDLRANPYRELPPAKDGRP